MVVVRGVPIESQYVIDTGFGRRVHDTLTLMGVGVAGRKATRTLEVAIARWMVSGLALFRKSERTSPLAVKEAFERHGEAIDFALTRLGTVER